MIDELLSLLEQGDAASDGEELRERCRVIVHLYLETGEHAEAVDLCDKVRIVLCSYHSSEYYTVCFEMR
jgi:hypothetical protein